MQVLFILKVGRGDDALMAALLWRRIMKYLGRTTLAELTGLNYSRDIRQKARELLRLLEEGKTSEPTDSLPIVCDDVPISSHSQMPLS